MRSPITNWLGCCPKQSGLGALCVCGDFVCLWVLVVFLMIIIAIIIGSGPLLCVIHPCLCW